MVSRSRLTMGEAIDEAGSCSVKQCVLIMQCILIRFFAIACAGAQRTGRWDSESTHATPVDPFQAPEGWCWRAP
jgi:hypothetical protein